MAPVFFGTVEAHTPNDGVIMQNETPERRFYLEGDRVYITEYGGGPVILTDTIRKDVATFTADYFYKVMGMTEEIFCNLLALLGWERG